MHRLNHVHTHTHSHKHAVDIMLKTGDRIRNKNDCMKLRHPYIRLLESRRKYVIKPLLAVLLPFLEHNENGQKCVTHGSPEGRNCGVYF